MEEEVGSSVVGKTADKETLEWAHSRRSGDEIQEVMSSMQLGEWGRYSIDVCLSFDTLP